MFLEVDIDQWPRKAAYEFFKDFGDPFFNFTANIDVGRLYDFCKGAGLSFSLSALFYSLETANEIREFRMRLKDETLIEFDRIHATQTILNDDQTFSFAYFPLQPGVAEFNESGRAALEKYKLLKSFDVESGRLDLIYYSVIPWISFTSFKHAGRLDRNMTIPRIVFGKMFESGGTRLMPLSVEANHMIMDGFHIGQYFNIFQEKILAI